MVSKGKFQSIPTSSPSLFLHTPTLLPSHSSPSLPPPLPPSLTGPPLPSLTLLFPPSPSSSLPHPPLPSLTLLFPPSPSSPLLVDRTDVVSSLPAACVASFSLFSFSSSLYYSPMLQPYNHQSCSYDQCGGCMGNSGCGFCVEWMEDSQEYLNGTCSPVTVEEWELCKQKPGGVQYMEATNITSSGSAELDMSSGMDPPAGR